MLNFKNLLLIIIFSILPITLGCTSAQTNQIKLIDINTAPDLNLIKNIVAACPMIMRQDGAFGTGILISREGYVLTDLHVTGIDDDLIVSFFKVNMTNPNHIEEVMRTTAKLITFSNDISDDLALIKVARFPESAKPLSLAPNESILKDQPVWRFGFNNSYRWAYGFYVVKESVQENYGGKKLIISGGPGASGGPIVNDLGQILGITQRGYSGLNEVVLEKSRRIYKYTPSVTMFMPVPKIREFILQSIKEKSLKLGDF